MGSRRGASLTAGGFATRGLLWGLLGLGAIVLLLVLMLLVGVIKP
jgi:hypothetical protein